MMGEISIVAGGWSVLNVAIDRLCGLVVGVNDAAVHLPRCDVAISMDRLWSEHRWAWLLAREQSAWLRRSAVQNIDTRGADWLTVFDCDYRDEATMTDDRGWLNGTNSGLCALNWAYQMRPRRVYLLGFDMTRDNHGRSHWYRPYSWAPRGATSNGKYRVWAGQFAHAARLFKAEGIDVRNVSPASAIDAFQKMTPAEYLKECNR